MNRYHFVGLFFLLNVYGAIRAMTMKMAPMPYEERKKGPTEQEIRASKKAIHAIVKDIRTIDSLLQKVKEKEPVSPLITQFSLNSALLKAVEWGEKGLIEDLLAVGADPNCNDGTGVPLDNVVQLKNIETLLKFKANPKLCTKWPIIKSMLYYINREVKEKDKKPRGYYSSNNAQWNVYYEQIEQEKMRLADKALRCMKLLLQAGAPVHEAANARPLKAVAYLVKKAHLPLKQGEEIAKVLISYGADPIESGIDYRSHSPYDFNYRDVIPLAKYMYQERKKYQAIRQLLIGNRDSNSILSILPKDILKEIGLMIKQGNFEAPLIKSACDEADATITENNNKDSMHTSDNVQNVEPIKNNISESVPINFEKSSADTEDTSVKNILPESITQNSSDLEDNVSSVKNSSDNFLPTVQTHLKNKNRPNRSRLAFLPAKIIIVGMAAVAAIGVGTWMYNKWQKKKQDEQETKFGESAEYV